jgi:hypothetical protein
LKECHTTLAQSIASRQSPWNGLNITPKILQRLAGIRENAIAKANSLEKNQCQQMSQDYLKVLAMKSHKGDICNMGYVDDSNNGLGQFTVARRVPGGDQVMGSLSLAMSLMNCVEIEGERKRIRVLEQQNKLIEQQNKLLHHEFSEHKKNTEKKLDALAAKFATRVTEANKNTTSLDDWSCVTVDTKPLVVLKGHFFSAGNYFLPVEVYKSKRFRAWFNSHEQYMIYCKDIPKERKYQIKQHMNISNSTNHFNLYQKNKMNKFNK